MKRTYIPPTIKVVRILQRKSLLITSTGNDKNIRYGAEYDGGELDEPR